MVSFVLTKETLQELGEICGIHTGALGAWLIAQSKAQCERGGNRCTLETVGSAWV